MESISLCAVTINAVIWTVTIIYVKKQFKACLSNAYNKSIFLLVLLKNVRYLPDSSRTLYCKFSKKKLIFYITQRPRVVSLVFEIRQNCIESNCGIAPFYRHGKRNDDVHHVCSNTISRLPSGDYPAVSPETFPHEGFYRNGHVR